ncbi:MAG: SRPBCC family protein [Vicinamibacterales bacterium]
MFRTALRLQSRAGRRIHARRFAAVVGALLLVSAATIAAAGARHQDSVVTVTQQRGLYHVTATFTVAQAPEFALATLTDYPQIPRFMPEVLSSRILERNDNRMVVEQEAIAHFAMFSKRVHLVLEVEQQPDTIRFRDRSGKSFERYEGLWTVTEQDGGTHITYELSAQPAFDVPGFMLKRLLKRDAVQMIERLSAEIDARAAQ